MSELKLARCLAHNMHTTGKRSAEGLCVERALFF